MTKVEEPAIKGLRALGRQKQYKAIFAYLMERTLPSKATDVYSVKEKAFSNSTLRDLLEELENIGVGRFLNGRSFSWEGFDLRAVGRLAIASGDYKMNFAGLYRADYDYQRESELKLIREAIVRPHAATKSSPDTKVDLDQFTEEELIAALESKGLEVFTRRKGKT